MDHPNPQAISDCIKALEALHESAGECEGRTFNCLQGDSIAARDRQFKDVSEWLMAKEGGGDE